MSSSTADVKAATAMAVVVTSDTLSVELSDGRTIAAPLAWFPRLALATAKERATWRFIGGGGGIHWPDVDEDISIENQLSGKASGESQTSFKKWLAGRSSRRKPDTRRKK